MKLGTLLRVVVEDGWRNATVVYHGLDGYGAKWGGYKLTDEDVALINSGGPMGPKPPENFQWFPDIMLDDVEWEVLPTLPTHADLKKLEDEVASGQRVLARFVSEEQRALGEIEGAMNDLTKFVDEREDPDA